MFLTCVLLLGLLQLLSILSFYFIIINIIIIITITIIIIMIHDYCYCYVYLYYWITGNPSRASGPPSGWPDSGRAYLLLRTLSLSLSIYIYIYVYMFLSLSLSLYIYIYTVGFDFHTLFQDEHICCCRLRLPCSLPVLSDWLDSGMNIFVAVGFDSHMRFPGAF